MIWGWTFFGRVFRADRTMDSPIFSEVDSRSFSSWLSTPREVLLWVRVDIGKGARLKNTARIIKLKTSEEILITLTFPLQGHALM